MKLRNILSLVLCVTLLVTLLSGCTLFGGGKLAYEIGDDGRFIYTVVRGENSSDATETAAKTVRNAIRDGFDCKVTMVKDNVVEAVSGSCEILIGDTNRPESAEALQALRENRVNTAFDFIVKIINNKICIQATTDEMIAVAAEWFALNYCQNKETWELLKNGYEFIYAKESESVYNTVAGVDVGLFTVVKPVEFSYIIGMEVEKLLDFYNTMGFEIDYIEDIDPAVTNEILVGNTTREESKSVTVEGDNYVIKVVGTKLVIKGGSDLATYRAIKHFTDLVKNSSKDGFFNWTDGYVINGKYDKEEKDVYTLNFIDEFDTATVNTAIWGDYNYSASRTSASSLGGKLYKVDPKNQSSAYTTDTGESVPQPFVYQADGNLVMAAMRVKETSFLGSYASTFNSMLYKYGLWEVRSKFGPVPACCSYWLNGTGEQGLKTRYGDISRSCFTEIDLVENYGKVNSFGSNIHRWWGDLQSDGVTSMSGHNTIGGDSRYHSKSNNADYKRDKERYGTNLDESFNTYTFYWDDTCMKFAFNGKTYLTYEYKDNESVSVHNILNYTILSFHMGMPGYGLAYTVGSSPDYCETYIDSVKIYQTGAINSQMLIGDGQWAGNVSSENTIIMYPENPIVKSH